MDNNYYNNDHHNSPGGGQGGGGNGGPKGPRINAIIVAIIAAVLMFAAISGMSSMIRGATYKEKSYTEFLADVEAGLVDEVDFTSDRITYTLKSDTQSNLSGLKLTYYTGEVNDDDLIPTLKAAGVNIVGYIPSQSNSILEFFVIWVLPMILIYVVFALIYRRMAKSGGDIMGMGVGKSTAKVYVQKDTGVTFKDVAGEDEAKESLMQIVDFLHNPGKYQQIGAKLPKGALLVGPPGTGKTLLAKAVAGEAKVPFFSLAGSDFVEMFVGVGATRVRDLFKEAQKMAPAIIFIDEIDAIGKSRDSRYGGNDEREQTLNQLLAEMDGFDSSKGLFILAATNRPEILDKALLRPGRFDRRIIVDKPDLKGRVAILKVHAKDVRMDDTVDLNAIALATSGAVGSDLANIINEGAIAAVEAGRRAVSQKDLMDAVEVVIAGKEKKDRIMNDQEKRTVAYHEVGHALIAALKKHSEPVQKITIVPRTMGALGYVLQMPEEERYLLSKDELLTRLVTFMGGRAAEEIVFNTVTTGASNDIEQATKVARAMITQYGMSEKFGLMALETVEDQYLSGRTVMNCSDETAAQIDEEVKTVLKQAYEEAKRILSENRDILDKIAEYLYEKETITGEEFMNILHLVETERAQAEEAAIEAKEKEEQNQSASDVQTPGTQEKADGNDTPKTPE
ncbi:MAG: ATP-dependent zinc metalloprotease FtsH [Lachnospiraceae bacterium]|jgi:cell division protease FtsH|nr:ATP-dependent zinc metalloprotease FtsH [Lachnospiraceae bacterium]MCH4030997.1 ATP-dependent zinc metalloprotease FtsH [Lachnospiraceae bacterium]MCI1362274.1 ATP-dependent zinc metalloprotease FtsH [Lachnospiraceae bacterium]MCI1381520.1 ATP-dependent zinc metalloprotease FtsH [Lachnospiraceae bacterium]MCI1402438.1 ATP-dependent zinc metalloprotease FtsH [Lachnospiraceae bacterium]